MMGAVYSSHGSVGCTIMSAVDTPHECAVFVLTECASHRTRRASPSSAALCALLPPWGLSFFSPVTHTIASSLSYLPQSPRHPHDAPTACGSQRSTSR